MIELLKAYYTKDGKKVVVLSFSGGKYLCNDAFGNKMYLSSSELSCKKVQNNIIEPMYSNKKDTFNFSEETTDSMPTIEPEFVETKKVDKIFFEGEKEDIFSDEPIEEEQEDIFDSPEEDKPKAETVKEDDFYTDLL